MCYEPTHRTNGRTGTKPTAVKPAKKRKVTDAMRLQVTKDRAADELASLIRAAGGYPSLKGKEKNRALKIGELLAVSDKDATTIGLPLAKKLKFLNGEEDLWYNQ